MPLPQITSSAGTLKLAGELRMADAHSIWRTSRRLVASSREPRLDIDLTDAQVVDGAIMSLLVELRAEIVARGAHSEFVGGSDGLRAVVHLYHGDEPARPRITRAHERVFVQLGREIVRGWASIRRLVVFIGELATALVEILRRPRTANWPAVPALTVDAGTDGIPIVLLLNFLVGFVFAFQSARELKLYGANIYVADIIGISITRELGPLMTAVIISGRSGAAFAAELGTMRVSEEIDALRTMGFAPTQYLIFPRVVALAIAAPILTLLGDLVGIIGGMVVGATTLEVGARAYIAELQTAVTAEDVWTGLVKSVVFGVAIALIGCQQGFAARGAATGVGRATTRTVVLGLFTIVLVDTLFTMLFRVVGE